MEEVKDYLGHSSIRVTSDRYGHLFPKARAVLADHLDTTFANAADFSRTEPGIAVLAECARAALAGRSPAFRFRADDGTRTRDPNLGKVVLYQLSHVRR